jgi:uncharacterized phage protein (predicted DNA packaging)
MSWTPQTDLTRTLLAAVRLALRITSTAYDDEIQDLIEAARSDLKTAGVSAVCVDATDPDALVKRAIVTYSKAAFGMDNPDADRYMAAYESLKVHLALSAEYRHPSAVGITGSITAGTYALTVSSATAIAEDSWLTVEGAGAGGALLIAQAAGIDGLVVTFGTLAGTTVVAAAVTVR